MRMLFIVWITPDDQRAEVIKRLTEAAPRPVKRRKSVPPVSYLAEPKDDICSPIVRQWQMGKAACYV